MRKRKDARSWKQWLDNQDTAWTDMIPHIVQAYMQWHYGTAASVDPEALPATTEIDILNFYSTATSVHIPQTKNSLTEDLVSARYLGTLPLYPSLAVSFKTLELFRCLKLFKPSFSTEAFTKLLCYLYYVSLSYHDNSTRMLTSRYQMLYCRHYCTAISDAFDIYLVILCHIKQQVSDALGRGAPDWRAQNACPACTYEVCTTFRLILPIDMRVHMVGRRGGVSRVPPSALYGWEQLVEACCYVQGTRNCGHVNL